MTRSGGWDGQSGATLLEVLVTLVVLTLLVGAVILTVPPGRETSLPGAERALTVLQSARASAISTGMPVWLTVSHDTISDGSSVTRLAPDTLLGPEGSSAPLTDMALLVQADGLIVGPRLRLKFPSGMRDLFVWQPTPGVAP